MPFAFVVTISFEPSGEKAAWPGVFTNSGVAAAFRPSCLVEPRQRQQMVEEDAVALQRAAVPGVQDVDDAVADCDADGERSTRRNDLEQQEPVAEHGEDGDGVAAGVDGVQQVVTRVESQGTLRSRVVDDRAREYPTEPSGRIDAGLGQVAIGRAVVGDHGVAGRVVGLDEDDVVRAAAEDPVAAPAVPVSSAVTNAMDASTSPKRARTRIESLLLRWMEVIDALERRRPHRLRALRNS